MFLLLSCISVALSVTQDLVEFVAVRGSVLLSGISVALFSTQDLVEFIAVRGSVLLSSSSVALCITQDSVKIFFCCNRFNALVDRFVLPRTWLNLLLKQAQYCCHAIMEGLPS